jgi:hypothetical protein
MDYDPSNLSALAYANGFTLWHYKTTDLDTEVDDSGYFDEAANMLRVGDFIFANTDTDGSPVHGVFAVLSNSGGVVDVSDLTGFGVGNSD